MSGGVVDGYRRHHRHRVGGGGGCDRCNNGHHHDDDDDGRGLVGGHSRGHLLQRLLVCHYH